MISTLSDLVKRTVRKAMEETRVSMPARVLSYDAGSRLARVQVLQSELTADGKTVSQPVITDVPVFMPIGGGAAVTFPIAAGDEGVVWFADQDIGGWVAAGSGSPDSGRRHALTDAMFMPARGRGEADADNLVITFGGATITIQPSGQVDIDSPAGITLTAASGASMNGDLSVDGQITATGEITSGTVELTTHTHSGGAQPDQ